MTLTLEIGPDLELRLKRAAQQRGLDTEECVIHLLEERLSGSGNPARAALEEDPLMAMAGVDDFEPACIDEVVYR